MKDYKNRSTLAKVIAKIKVGPFCGLQCKNGWPMQQSCSLATNDILLDTDLLLCSMWQVGPNIN